MLSKTPIFALCANNASPFTGTGTITHIIGENQLVIMDPGPDNDDHLAAILTQIGDREVAAIMISHTHRDHSQLSNKLKSVTGAKILGCTPYLPNDQKNAIQGLDASHDLDYHPDSILQDGDIFEFDGCALEAIHTPGHAENHLCFALLENDILFSGDHVMGWATTIVAPPDGDMTDYIQSLDKLISRPEIHYYPAHGDPIKDGNKYTRALKGHRLHRQSAILAVFEANRTEELSLTALLDRVYRDIDPKLRYAASLTLFSHLEKLVRENRVQKVKEDAYVLL